jgi:dihydropteroate synthase
MIAQIVDISNKRLLDRLEAAHGRMPRLEDGEKAVWLRGDNLPHINDILDLSDVFSRVDKLPAPDGKTSFILCGAPGAAFKALRKAEEHDALKLVGEAAERYLSYSKLAFEVGSKRFPTNRLTVMGILNVTPDSFSDGGEHDDPDAAEEHAGRLVEAEADIIDVGGESTRPGADPVSAEEEKRRVLPVVERIKKQFPDAVVSIDTTKAEVAEAALAAGAEIVNDISGGTFDPNMAKVVAARDAGYVIMHTLDKPKTMQKDVNYADVVVEIYDFLAAQIERAEQAGVRRIVVDPGIGFGKTPDDNFELIDRLADFRSLGKPIMLGVSRKSFLGKSLGAEPGERDFPTAVVEAMSAARGAAIIRTHNAEYARTVKRLADFVVNGFHG